MKTTLRFYLGSYQFDSVTTDRHITTNFIKYKLAAQYEYRPTDETLWAEVVDGDVHTRYQLIPEELDLRIIKSYVLG
jgi:hypothetical protein